MVVRDLRQRAARQGAGLTTADYELFNTATTYLRGLKYARAHGLEAEYGVAFDNAARRVAGELVREQRDYSLGQLLLQAMVAVIGLAAVAAGVFLVPIAPERLIVVLLILARLAGPFQYVQVAMQQIGYTSAAYRSLDGLTECIAAPPQAPPARTGPGLARAPEIRFRGVSYTSGEAGLLHDISCEIPAGRVTAVIGPSGAGKSLFCDLAVGLLSPCAGRVEVDGVALEGEMLRRLRISLGYVAQDPFSIEDNLRASLTWHCGAVGDDEIWRALEIVGAAGLVRGLSQGLDKPTREPGLYSGGERQRFRLAHALLRRPRLLILDEATNALDIDSEIEVLRTLREAARKSTVLLVTHRLSTVSIADKVLLLEGGRLVWAGPPQDLPSRAGMRAETRAGPG